MCEYSNFNGLDLGSCSHVTFWNVANFMFSHLQVTISHVQFYLLPKFPISFMPQELCKLVCIPWTTNNAGSFQLTKNTLLNIGSWVGSFHCNIQFICGSHHPCNTNLMFVGRPCQIQTNPQWSSPPPCHPPPPFLFLKIPLYSSLFIIKRFLYRFLAKTAF